MIAFITGATSGLGKATAEIFAKNGYNIVITGRRKERLEELSKQLSSSHNVKVFSLNFDVRELKEVEAAVDSLPTEWTKIDILVIPSAEHHLDTDLEDEVMLNFVKKVNKDAEFIISHCDGAFVLAEAGLLKNKVTTTFPTDIEKMRKRYPNLDIREDVLFVHDGKYITSAGGAKSFEAALYLCEYLYGKKIAESLSAGLVIDWDLANVAHVVIK